MTHATPDDATPTPVVGIKATVACTNPTCDHYGQWHRIHDTHTGPVHCGGCYGVLHCDHTRTNTGSTYGGTLTAPLRADTTTCVDCHHILSRKQTPITLDEVPLQLPHAVHNT